MFGQQSHLLHSTKGSDIRASTYQSSLSRTVKRADSDIEKMFREIRKVKYPVLAIDPAEQLEHKINQFKNEKLQTMMKQKLIEQKHLNAYRKIRGDGNCFIRALAYSYLSNSKDLSNVQSTFFQLQDIQLTVCHPSSVPKQFKPFYNDKMLKEFLLNNWPIDVQFFRHLCNKNNKRILSRMFRRSPYLDFIVVLYFRSLCLKGLEKHKEEVKDFMKGTQEDEIRTYGEESEGVVLDICSRYLKVAIDVYEVRKQELKHYSYRNQRHLRDTLNVSLLYYQNHYDIIETVPQNLLIEEQNDAKIVEEEYYSKLNENMIEGTCIQCEKEDYIYEENNLCDNCFQISKSQMLNNMKQDKWVRGVCRDCGRSGLKVLEMISLCENCVKRQSEVNQEDIKATSSKESKTKCQKCFRQLNSNQQCPFCSTTEVGICLQCDIKNYIDKETKLCGYCRKVHQSVMTREQKRKQYIKSLCPNCNQPTTSSYHEYNCVNKLDQFCHFCNERKDSQVHEMKCIKKLAAGKIGMSKTQKISLSDQMGQAQQSRTCRKCNLVRPGETLVGGWCKKCHDYFMAEDRHKNESTYFGSGNAISQSSHKVGDSRVSSQGQTCKKCKRTFYVHKLNDGLCSTCESHKGGFFKF